ncbi:MAG: OmpH family outer membrane protein [Nitrospirota bacterium]
MKRWLVFVSVAAMVAAGPVAAQELKIGYVDAQQALDQSKIGRASKEQLEQYVKSRQQVIDVDEEEIRRLEEELKKQTAVLSPEAQRDKQETFQRKLLNYQKKAGELSKEVSDKRAEVLKEFNGKLSQALRRVAEQGGYAIVLDKESEGGVVLYAREQMNLTEHVIAELDRMAAGDSGKPAKPSPSGGSAPKP